MKLLKKLEGISMEHDIKNRYGIKKDIEDRVDYSLFVYTFIVMMGAALISQLYTSGSIGFLLFLVLFLAIGSLFSYQLKKYIKAGRTEVKDFITRKNNELIRDTIKDIEKEFNIIGLSVSDMQKLVWISKDPYQDEEQKEIFLNNYLKEMSTPVKKDPAKTATKKTPAKTTTAKKTPAKTTTAKKTPAKTTTAKKDPVKTTTAKKTPVKTTTAKKAPVKATTAKKTPAKNTAKKIPVKTITKKVEDK